jgi:autotransporter family porin
MSLGKITVARVLVPAILAATGAVALAQAAPASVAAAATRLPSSGLSSSAASSVGPSSAGVSSSVAPSSAGKAKPVYFHTLPPGAKLPSGATCARLVNATRKPEVKAANKPFNRRKGTGVGRHFFSAGDSPLAQKRIAPLITGDFTGTTIDILRWVACKWGIDQDMVFAQAAVESWWQQDTLGDWGTDAAACPPGHKLGQDGKAGECPQSYGILQNRYPYEDGGWPAMINSTAMNADAAYGIWRACFDGYETWLNTVPRGTQYHAGDAWGCVGRWFAGRWRTSAALGYIAKVKQYLKEKIWLKPYFRQTG